jgi:transposase
MIRIHLDESTRSELQAMRTTGLPPKARNRLEMVLLSDAGWSAPRIARHLRCHPHTSRAALKDFQARGTDALFPGKPGPAPDEARRRHVGGLLRDLLGQERTWSSAQLSDALVGHGVRLSARQVRRHLRGLRAGYRRTAATVRHKQNPAKVARAKVVLEGLKKKRAPAG